MLDRKNLLLSMGYTLVTLRRTPVIFVNERLVSQGRVPQLGELRRWIRQARSQEEVS